MLLVAACGDTVSTGEPAAEDVSGDISETFSAPPTEGTGPESPQPPVDKPTIQLGGPGVEGGIPTFRPDDSAQCGTILFGVDLDEDVRVESVSITPADAFVRDDSACGDEGYLCFGFVFRSGDLQACSVGIRWRPQSGVGNGALTLTFGAVCTTRDDALCGELTQPPPSGGQPVQFRGGTRLEGVLDEETDDPEPDPSSGSGTPTPTTSATPGG